MYIDLEHTVRLRPRFCESLVLPLFWKRWGRTPDQLWCLAPYYFAELQDILDPLDLPGFERWEYSYALRGDPQRTLAQYLDRSLPGLAFLLPTLAEIDAYPPWDGGPKHTQELRSWLRDALHLDAPDWEWACARTHQGAYPRALVRTLQQQPAFWAQGLAASDSVRALSAFQVDMLLEGASARLWSGPFLLLHAIGSGGMGTVWVARDPGLNRAVAIKLIRADQVPPDFEPHFRQEARRLARLKHPHIAAVHFAPARGELFMAMELVGRPGSPLGQDGQPVSLDQVVVWLVQILQALAYAHAQGIVHRDLKPQNLIVDEDGKVVLVDFGLAGARQSPVEPAAVPRAGWWRVYAATWSWLWPWLWPLLPLVPPGSPVWEPLLDSVPKRSCLFLPPLWASVRAALARVLRVAIWGRNASASTVLHYPLPDELTEGLKHFAGSAEYAAPEQWVYPTVLGPPVDIYPLGHIVVELLVGQPPFRDGQERLPPEVAIHIVPVPPGEEDEEKRTRHERLARLQAQHVFMEPPVPQELKEVTMPQGLVTLIKAMLAKHPAHRPSADQLVQVLEPYLYRGGLLILLLFVWGLAAALGAGGLTVLWMRAIGGTPTDEPHGLAAAVWALLSTAPVLTVAAWVRCRYELQSLRQQLPACLYMLVVITAGATWFYSVRVGDALSLRHWFAHYAPLEFVGRETWLAVFWAALSSLPGFALLRVLLRIPEQRAWAVAVGTSLGVLAVFFLLSWWGAGLLGGLAALVWLGRGLLGLRGCARWSFPQWFGPFLSVLAVVGIVVPFVLLLGDQPKADWVRGVLAGVALRLGLFWGFLLLARRVPWDSVDCVQPATRPLTQRDPSTGTP